MAANVAMIAMTTNNSIRVKPWLGPLKERLRGANFVVESMSRPSLRKAGVCRRIQQVETRRYLGGLAALKLASIPG
jgi:hypothetical protein